VLLLLDQGVVGSVQVSDFRAGKTPPGWSVCSDDTQVEATQENLTFV